MLELRDTGDADEIRGIFDPAELRPYVQWVWCLEAEAGEAAGPPPSGSLRMALSRWSFITGTAGSRSCGYTVRAAAAEFVVCQTRRYIEIQPSGPTCFISVRFRPWGAYHFLGDPISAVADQVVPAEDIWGAAVRELEQRLAMARSLPERVVLVEQFLMRQICRHQKAHVEGPLRAVRAKAGKIEYAQLYGELGITERTAQRTFARVVGMAPRSYGRLVRFLQTCSFLRRREWTTLAESAYGCGYFDQSHLISDFQTFAEITPGEFVARRQLSFFELT